jgi:hypothetical protein
MFNSKHVSHSLFIFLIEFDLFILALESVRNLRVISILPMLKEIEVNYDQPSGCFDRLVLICEILSLKQRRAFINSTSCTDLIPEEVYRISIETKRVGWETMTSNIIETRLVLTSDVTIETNKSIFLSKLNFYFFFFV